MALIFMTALIFHLERNITSPLFYDTIVSWLFCFVKGFLKNSLVCFKANKCFHGGDPCQCCVFCFKEQSVRLRLFSFPLTIIIIANTFIFCNR